MAASMLNALTWGAEKCASVFSGLLRMLRLSWLYTAADFDGNFSSA
jgi:hypothetical protein